MSNLRIIFKGGEVREYANGEWTDCRVSQTGKIDVLNKNEVILQTSMENIVLIEILQKGGE